MKPGKSTRLATAEGPTTGMPDRIWGVAVTRTEAPIGVTGEVETFNETAAVPPARI